MSLELDRLWPALAEELEPVLVASRERPTKPARTSDRLCRDARLDRDLREALHDRVLAGNDPYTHQVSAIEAALDGRDVVLETATASGKSLCYWTPILNEIIRRPPATAIYVAPLNALVADQIGAVARFATGHASADDPVLRVGVGPREVVVGRYDGGVELGRRPYVRRADPSILVTNPDMLHHGILPHHQRLWPRLLAELRYLVIDEMHVYRGMFGASMAGLVRRLLRLVPDGGRRVRVIGCSASIGNPEELFALLTGRTEPAVLRSEASGAPVHRRRVALLDPERGARSAADMAAELTARLVGGEGVPTIAFMRSVAEVDRVYRDASRALRQSGSDATLRQYKRLIPAADKHAITQELRDGRALGVVTTSALQAGIDIGALSAAIVCRLPASRADLMQQTGRVGRTGEGLSLVVAGESAVDRHYVRRPEALLDDPPAESVYLNPDNPVILSRQLLCAARERPLRAPADIRVFGRTSTRAEVTRLIEGGLLRQLGDGLVGPTAPGLAEALRVPMRTPSFDLPVRDEHGREVARPDALQAMRQFHPSARFAIQGRHYEVTALELDWKRATGSARAVAVGPPHFATGAPLESTIEIVDTRSERALGPTILAHGGVRLELRVTRYREFRRGQRPSEHIALGHRAPPSRRIDTEGLWLALSASFAGKEARPAAESVAGALRLSGAHLCSTDPGDLAAQVGPGGEGWLLILSDVTPGGDGIASALFERAEELVDGALRVLEGCPYCSRHPRSRGCPSCVAPSFGGEESVDRAGAIEALRALGARGDASLNDPANGDEPEMERWADEDELSGLYDGTEDPASWVSLDRDAELELIRDRAADGPLFGIDEDGDLVTYEEESDPLAGIPDPGGFPGDDSEEDAR